MWSKSSEEIHRTLFWSKLFALNASISVARKITWRKKNPAFLEFLITSKQFLAIHSVLVRGRDTNYEAVSVFDAKAYNIRRWLIWNNLNGKEHHARSWLVLKTSCLPRKFLIECHYLALLFDIVTLGQVLALKFSGSDIDLSGCSSVMGRFILSQVTDWYLKLIFY